jgi:DNA primase
MRLSQETIDQIRLRADVLEVVGDFVSLKKKGQNYWACCPFHDEKTPSFSVNPVKGIYKCFGCGKAGDAIRFVMDVEGVSYVESLRYLAKKYDIPVEESETTSDEEALRQHERDSLYIISNFAKSHFQQQLHETDEGKAFGMSYFRERQFNQKTIQAFELGYSQKSYDALLKDALGKGHSQELLEKAGLVVRHETGRVYDRFRDRVIFPIHNLSGRVIAFGARMLGQDKNQPKYLNSPETDIYHKSQVLYGIYQAKQAIRQQDLCLLTEGYTDVISLHQAGIEHVVASSGTSLTIEQIRLIRRFTTHVVLLYDGDNAGIKAALRGMDLMLEEEMDLKVVILPNGDDPDSYLKKVGVASFKEYLQKNARDLVDLKISLFEDEARKDPLKKAQAASEILQSLARIANPTLRQLYLKATATRLDVDENSLYLSIGELMGKESKRQLRQVQQRSDLRVNKSLQEPQEEPYQEETQAKTRSFVPLQDPVVIQEQEIIRLLLHYASFPIYENQVTLGQYLIEELENLEFQHEVYRKIIGSYRQQLVLGSLLTEQFFLHHPDADIQQEAIQLLSLQWEFSDNWEKYEIYVPHERDHLANVAYSSVHRFKQRFVQKRMGEIMKILQQANEFEQQMKLMQEYRELKEMEKKIAKLLGNVIR